MGRLSEQHPCEGAAAVYVAIGHVHIPMLAIKAPMQAVALSLWADINCGRTPSLETKILPWTVAFTIVSYESN